MNSREVIAKHLCKRAGQGWSGISPYERGVYRTRAHNILAEIDAAGFVIMSKEDVAAIRDKALGEAAEVAEDKAQQWDSGKEGGANPIHCGLDIADAIRSLKSEVRDAD